MSVSGIVSQAVPGGAGGAILTAIIGAIENRVAAYTELVAAFRSLRLHRISFSVCPDFWRFSA
jgi:hypothetical protein